MYLLMVSYKNTIIGGLNMSIPTKEDLIRWWNTRDDFAEYLEFGGNVNRTPLLLELTLSALTNALHSLDIIRCNNGIKDIKREV